MRTFIREKKIFCGPEFLEVDLYPYTEEQKRATKGKRSKKEAVTPPKQMNLNDKNARRYLTQLSNTNFGEADLHTTATYSKANLPASVEEAEKEIRNYLRRVDYKRRKEGLPPLKYILVTAYSTGKDGEKPTRIHHHIFMSGGLDRDIVEDLWRKRKRKGQKKGDKIGFINADRIQPDENGVAALCEYLAKQAKGKKRWSSSQNLDKPDTEITDPGDPQRTEQSRFSASQNLDRPTYRTNDHAYSRRELEKICKEPPDPAYWERRYPGYELIRNDYAFKAEYDDYRGWAVYLKLRKKD